VRNTDPNAKHYSNSGITRNLLGRLGWLRNPQFGSRDYDNKLFISEYVEIP
jgi:hypothetical protein